MGELLSFDWRPSQKPSKRYEGQTAEIVIFPGIRVVYIDPAEQAALCVPPKRKRTRSALSKSKTDRMRLECEGLEEAGSVEAFQCAPQDR